jgi:hypothetical protein
MAQPFSIEIPLNGVTHKAVVEIRQKGCDLICFVRYTDKKMQCILPGDSLVFGLMEGLKEPTRLPNKSAERLVKYTIRAIAAHLQDRDLMNMN